MLRNEIERFESDALSALTEHEFAVAKRLVTGLRAKRCRGTTEVEYIIQALSRIAEAAGDIGPAAGGVATSALLGQVIEYRDVARFDEALEILADLQSRRPFGRSAGVVQQRIFEVTRLGLLYLTGRLDDLRVAAHADITEWLGIYVDPAVLVEALWLGDFAKPQEPQRPWPRSATASTTASSSTSQTLRAKVDSKPPSKQLDAIRERLISHPDSRRRAAAAEGTSRALWLAILAEDSEARLCTVSALEGAFASEQDRSVELYLAQELLIAAGWLSGHAGSLDSPLQQALSVAHLVSARFEQSVSQPELRLLAWASLEKYRVLGVLGRVDEQAVAADQLISLGAIAAKVLAEQLALDQREDADPMFRAYLLDLAMMHALATGHVPDQHERSLSLLDAVVERYLDDPSGMVQEAVRRLRLIRDKAKPLE